AGGYVIGTTDELGQVTVINRDLNTNVALSKLGPCGCTDIVRTFDANGNHLSETDRLGNSASYQYDAVFNRLAQKVEKNGNKTIYSYDTKGNLLSATNGLNQATTYFYDSAGKRLAVADALGHLRRMEYDANANLNTLT